MDSARPVSTVSSNTPLVNSTDSVRPMDSMSMPMRDDGATAATTSREVWAIVRSSFAETNPLHSPIARGLPESSGHTRMSASDQRAW